MKPLLEERLNLELGRKAKERAHNLRQLIVTLMSDDTEPHQTARRWVPRKLSSPNAELAR